MERICLQSEAKWRQLSDRDRRNLVFESLAKGPEALMLVSLISVV